MATLPAPLTRIGGDRELGTAKLLGQLVQHHEVRRTSLPISADYLTALSRRYGVSRTQIYKIRDGKQWEARHMLTALASDIRLSLEARRSHARSQGAAGSLRARGD